MATKKTSSGSGAGAKASKKKKAGPSVTNFLQKLGGAPSTRGKTPARGLLGDIQREDLVRAGRIAGEVDDALDLVDDSRTTVHVEVSQPRAAGAKDRKLDRAEWTERVEVRGVFTPSARASRSVNLSVGGIFVETAEILEVGDPVMLSFPVDDGHVMHVHGRVRWVTAFGGVDDARPGMGITFVGLDERKRVRLERLLRSLPRAVEGAGVR